MWYKTTGQRVELRIIAKPNAKRTALLAVAPDALHIALHAKPQQGKANEELIAYLAELLKQPKSEIKLKRGEGSRVKTLVVTLNTTTKQFLVHPGAFVKK